MPIEGVKLCGAKTRAGGECEQPAMTNGRCKMHGGKSLGGDLSPTLRTGRYSKYLPARLAASYEEAVSDPELLSVREDIALLDSRLNDVMAAASNQESGELWENLKAAVKEYKRAAASGAKDAEQKRSEAISQILWLVQEGYQEWQSWKDIRFMLQERVRLVESERKRLVEMQQMITNEDALLLIGRLGGILRKHITDRETLRAIADELRQITG